LQKRDNRTWRRLLIAIRDRQLVLDRDGKYRHAELRYCVDPQLDDAVTLGWVEIPYGQHPRLTKEGRRQLWLLESRRRTKTELAQ